MAAVAVALLALGPATAAAAPVQVAVKAKPPPVNEREGAAAGGYLSWDQNSRSDPGHVNEYVQRSGKTPVRVNAAGTEGFGGGIWGRTLVYQQVTGGHSDLRLFDLLTHHRRAPFAGVNTELYEWHPTISGSWILFGRRGRNGGTTVLLANTSTHAVRRLDRATPPGSVDPGQVSGDWVTWDHCSSRCNVFRYRISTGSVAKVPNPLRRFQLDPGVDSSGNVFYNRSGRNCGRGVRIMELPRGGSPRTVLALKTTNDTGFMYVNETGSAGAHLLFNKFHCSTQNWDIFRIAVP
jgi:hypothetical protein